MSEYIGAIFYDPELDKLDYGILRKSGRYPWGSGKDEYVRSLDFYKLVDGLKEKGLPDKEIAQAIGMSVADLRSTRTIAKEQIVLEQTNRAVTLRDKGTSIDAISKELGIPQPTVRLRLKNSENMKESSLRKTAEVLRKNVDDHEIVDIGKGVNLHMGISPERLKAATAVLRDEGYEVYNLQVKNVGTNNNTNQLVIVPPGTGFGGAKKMTDRIHTMGEWSEDGGLTFFGIHPPKSVSSKRMEVVYESDEDGTVYIRRGVPDLDMGKNNYAQVRIAVDGTHFIKGMAVLRDDLPPGVDIQFHSSKKADVGKIGALKPLKDDKDNPFGSVIKRQIVERDKDGIERVKSALNIVNEEGDWDTWGNSMPSQMLAKQPHSLIKSQLGETRDVARQRLADIEKITNPIVKRKALEDFADQVDADAVDLRAAQMPRQRTQVILPAPVKKGEIYAPNFETGERVVLIRYPHGGRFEIPEVTVNNNARKAKQLLGNATDAIGIHPSVAARLSGADFDGDTVVVIPNRQGKIKGAESLGSAKAYYDKELGSFDAKRKYGGFVQRKNPDGSPMVDKKGDPVGNFPLMKNTGLEMGMITNLVTDMSIQGAKPEHVVRAVRHSMVVIDAEKHKLNYKQSAIDNGITQLKTLYQGGPKSGSTTLLSQATAKDRVNERKLRPAKDGSAIDPKTGARVYVDTGKQTNKYDPKTQTYLDEKVNKTQNVKRLELTDDAYTLVRDKADPVEKLYADHANEMKALANTTRLKAARVPSPPTNKLAKLQYKDEVDTLVRDLNTALKQKPLDRRADVIAGSVVKAKRQEDPTLRLDRDRLKKVERQAKKAARARLGLERPVIPISDRQWDAIQSGAVSPSRLRAILEYADPKRVAELSMPRTNTVMTSAVAARAKAMLATGATTADVAAALGVSASTLRGAALRGEV